MSLDKIFRAHGLKIDYTAPTPAAQVLAVSTRIALAEAELGIEQPIATSLSIKGSLVDENVVVIGEPEATA